MAITVGAIVENQTAATTLSITPTCSANDVLLKAVITDSATGTTFTPPASFDQLVNSLVASSDGGSLGVFRKKTATGSEGSLSTTNSPSQAMVGAILAISGVDNTTPEDVTPPAAVVQTTPQAAPLVMTSNSITPVTDGALIVAFMLIDVTSSEARTATFSTASGTTGAWTTLDPIQSGFYNLAIGYAPQTTAGAITVTGTSGGAASAAGSLFVIALRPAGSGSTVTKTPAQAVVTVNPLAPTTNAFTYVAIRDTLINESGQPVASAANIRLMVWYGGQAIGAPDYSANGLTTDPTGSISWSVAKGTLINGQAIFYVAQDSISYSNYTCGRVIPTYG